MIDERVECCDLWCQRQQTGYVVAGERLSYTGKEVEQYREV